MRIKVLQQRRFRNVVLDPDLQLRWIGYVLTPVVLVGVLLLGVLLYSTHEMQLWAQRGLDAHASRAAVNRELSRCTLERDVAGLGAADAKRQALERRAQSIDDAYVFEVQLVRQEQQTLKQRQSQLLLWLGLGPVPKNQKRK
jgi:hypothetical protein